MSGSVDAEASHRDLVYRLQRRPRMSRLGNTTITASTTVSTGTLVTPTDQSVTGLSAFCRVIGVSSRSCRVNTWQERSRREKRRLKNARGTSARISPPQASSRSAAEIPSAVSTCP